MVSNEYRTLDLIDNINCLQQLGYRFLKLRREIPSDQIDFNVGFRDRIIREATPLRELSDGPILPLDEAELESIVYIYLIEERYFH